MLGIGLGVLTPLLFCLELLFAVRLTSRLVLLASSFCPQQLLRACVRVCVWLFWFSVCVCVYVSKILCVCVCVCVNACARVCVRVISYLQVSRERTAVFNHLFRLEMDYCVCVCVLVPFCA